MPVKPILDYEFLKKQPVLFGIEEIRKINPQRFEMEHLTAITYLDLNEGIIGGYKDVKDDEFWVRGHLPDRPLLPGVIMIEAGAQLSSFLFHKIITGLPFFGFGGADDVRFRGTVSHGDRLYLMAKKLNVRKTRGYFYAQGMVNGKLVFEAKVLGLAL